MKVRFRRIDPEAMPPTRKHPTDGGWDLYLLRDTVVMPGTPTKARTGLAVAIPPGYVGLILERSGLATRGVHVGGGVIDSGYTGEVCIILESSGLVGFVAGSRVAQLVILPVSEVEWIEVEQLDDTPRGDGGFGSTGE